jgi:hypothetical protein
LFTVVYFLKKSAMHYDFLILLGIRDWELGIRNDFVAWLKKEKEQVLVKFVLRKINY